MQERHTDRSRYFNELYTTCKKYFIPYIQRFFDIRQGMDVLEIGCGDGGNLLAFFEMGCRVTGVDAAACRIDDAKRFFNNVGAEGHFIASDIFKVKELEHSFDIIVCHDVLEHIDDKKLFLLNLKRYIKNGGAVFMSFPAWQMPFGGHQQICRSRLLSHLPFFHLMPKSLYCALLRACGESDSCVRELMSIKRTATTIELFEKLVRETCTHVVNRTLFLVNPHYEVKFGMRPRKLDLLVSKIPYVRDFFSTSCFYMIIYPTD
jgi:2-polyprenyl-3-methyl-5-hydroxy-6-metoxy-1,4-benzoquinol methylase